MIRAAAICLMLTLFAGKGYSSDELDAGIFAGTSYYRGNLNPSLHFHRPSPAFGALMRYNFNEHYALKMGFNFGQISAEDTDFEYPLNQARQAGFVNNFYDFSLTGEFNFMPFKVTIFSKPISTYITAGIAYTFVPDGDGPASTYLNLPFGGGVKYGISRRITIGLEWILKKNFRDDIDGVKSFGQFDSPSFIHNNDWVSLAGFFVTIKPFERRGDCPVYWY
ncbi:MAG: hypothetical protein EA408_02250 [Marinilabiliales bacterium]|nr:MAG: hypothetical protein EA408_02250 [Marinilabiliales bacterium]